MLQAKSKYKSIPVNGFASKKEYRRYLNLKEKLDRGEIYDLKTQVKFELIPSQKLYHDRVSKNRTQHAERPVTYIADFVYYNSSGRMIVEDTKGMRTPEYIIKRKLMLYIKGIQITEV